MPMSLSAMLIASPMPRVPPVTIATRAMILSCSRSGGAYGCGSQPASSRRDQRVRAWSMPSGESLRQSSRAKCSPPAREERLAAADAELFQRLEAVGGKARRGDGDALDALAPDKPRASRRSRARAISRGRSATGTRRRPRGRALRRQQPRGLLAMAMIGIAELERALRHAVEAQQQPLGLEIERRELPRRGSRAARRCRADRRNKAAACAAPAASASRASAANTASFARRRRRRAILRIERRGEDARAALARPCASIAAAMPGLP